MRQLALLPPEVPDVPGLAYVERWITEDEERALIAAIDAEPWDLEWRRRRQIYGLSYGAESRGPLPAWSSAIAARVVREGWLEDDVANIVVNEYLPGQGIGMHHDYPSFGPTVVAVSLGSPCVLELTRGDRKASLDVAPRSLWVLGGDARRVWKHGIAQRQSDVIHGVRRPRGRRISVTMRTSRRTDG